MFKCSDCKSLLPETAFHKRSPTKGSSRPVQYKCRECQSGAMKKFRSENPDKYDRAKKQIVTQYRLRTYGLTAEQYEAMIEAQDGKCAICGEKPSWFVIDHCHTSGKVRSLLCNGCNVGLGMFDENRERMLKAIDYLDKHQ